MPRSCALRPPCQINEQLRAQFRGQRRGLDALSRTVNHELFPVRELHSVVSIAIMGTAPNLLSIMLLHAPSVDQVQLNVVIMRISPGE